MRDFLLLVNVLFVLYGILNSSPCLPHSFFELHNMYQETIYNGTYSTYISTEGSYTEQTEKTQKTKMENAYIEY